MTKMKKKRQKWILENTQKSPEKNHRMKFNKNWLEMCNLRLPKWAFRLYNPIIEE